MNTELTLDEYCKRVAKVLSAYSTRQYVTKLVANYSKVDDHLQETYLECYRTFKYYKGNSTQADPVLPWVLLMAKNVLRNQWQVDSAQKRAAYSSALRVESYEDITPLVTYNYASYEMDLLEVEKIIKRKWPVQYKFYELQKQGYSPNETADRFGIRLQNVTTFTAKMQRHFTGETAEEHRRRFMRR